MEQRKMKSNIAPLCPQHRGPMSPAQITLNIAGSASTLDAYACPQIGCNYRYNIGHGYFDPATGDYIKESSDIHRCVECRERLYIARFDEITANKIWLCSNEVCPSSRID